MPTLVTPEGHITQQLGRRFGTDDPVIGLTVPPSTRPKALAMGITSRGIDQAQGPLRALIDATVIDFYWLDAMPTNAGLSSSWVASVIAWLDWCHANTGTSGLPIKVCLRPRVGFYAPSWVKDDAGVGRLRWYTNHGLPSTDPNNLGSAPPSDPLGPYREYLPGTAKWWAPTYLNMCDDFYGRLATAFASHPAVAEIDVAYPSTQFMEPCNKQSGNQENVKVMLDNGWTETLDDAVFLRGWTSYMTSGWHSNRVACFTSYNPTGKYVPDVTKLSGFKFTPQKNMPRCIALMEKQMAVTGGCCILANESLTSPWPTASGAAQAQMYVRQIAAHTDAALPVSIAYQSETLTKINAKYASGDNVQAVINDAISMGAHRLEIPIGCQTLDPNFPLSYVSPAFATSASTQLRANSSGLIVP